MSRFDKPFQRILDGKKMAENETERKKWEGLERAYRLELWAIAMDKFYQIRQKVYNGDMGPECSRGEHQKQYADYCSEIMGIGQRDQTDASRLLFNFLTKDLYK